MKYRKKPVVIEAVQWQGKYSHPPEWPDWFRDAVQSGILHNDEQNPKVLLVNTFEGPLTAQPDDWIIQGVKGELYPCKPDIFAATYESA